MVIGASWVLSKTISRQMEQGLDTLQWEKSREEEEIAELQKNTAFPSKNPWQVPFWLSFLTFFDAFSRGYGQKKGKNWLF